MLSLDNVKIAIIGLGYVGLPLAVEFGKQFPTLGYDISEQRIRELKMGQDSTCEVESELLNSAKYLTFAAQESELTASNVYIVTVPTPIDEHKRPDLSPLIGASQLIARYLKKGDVVVFESTVYPGTTEEECIPVIEAESGLVFNRDFYAGYSPERINPGDKQNRISTIVKVTSGSTPDIADFVDDLYKSIITAGTHKASSIKVAEAAKVIENTQRDVNIALMNELAIIFNKLDINTQDVLAAAGTKWNFLPFKPGLVGGHCIGVDPYYLTHKAQAVGYHPNMILAARRINDGMGHYVAGEMIKAMAKKGIPLKGAKVLVLGLTFKENCPDIRNTRVIDMVRSLEEYGVDVVVCDPWVNAEDIEYQIDFMSEIPNETFDGLVVAVKHRVFENYKLGAYVKEKSVIYDLKGIVDESFVCERL
ncbi:nucleotide sugar dehydrogenase [Aliamphritea hakodatensis]|uniref:nucleotide sugar dehydrogenase n=1 Tax=Aliamphritea hakodatensis TaxID=2895352 RepID=UPI0022FD448A|nr:nucleotide sugar dehydrogenase [Aliamphritea hakodatensis]